MSTFKTAAIFAKRSEPMGKALETLLDILRQEGVTPMLEESTATHLEGYRGWSLDELGANADVIIIIGGVIIIAGIVLILYFKKRRKEGKKDEANDDEADTNADEENE